MSDANMVDEILPRVKKLIAEVFNTNEDKITMETNFLEDLGAESLDIVTLLMEFEDEFDSQIPDEDAEKLLTVGDAVNYIVNNHVSFLVVEFLIADYEILSRVTWKDNGRNADILPYDPGLSW